MGLSLEFVLFVGLIILLCSLKETNDNSDLTNNIDNCLQLDRKIVEQASRQWSWINCWTIFRDNLIKVL